MAKLKYKKTIKPPVKVPSNQAHDGSNSNKKIISKIPSARSSGIPSPKVQHSKPTSAKTSPTVSQPSTKVDRSTLQVLKEENDRLKTENKSLRTRLLQTVASDQSQISAKKSQQTIEERDEEDTMFMMLQEYIAENENLRTNNSELKQQFDQTHSNMEHITLENDDLKTRIIHLERQVETTSNSAFRDHRQRILEKSTMAQSHELFMKKMASERYTTPVHTASSQTSPNSVPLLDSPSQASTPFASLNLLKAKRKNALEGMTRSGASSKVENEKVSPPAKTYGYLQKFTTHKAPQQSTKTNLESQILTKPSPRQVAIIKPKPKIVDANFASYGALQQHKREALSIIQNQQQPFTFDNQNQLIQPRLQPEPIFTSVPKVVANTQVSVIKKKVKSSHKAPPSKVWNTKLQNLSKMNSKMREDIRQLEQEISSLKHY